MERMQVALFGGADGFFGKVHLESARLGTTREVVASVLSRDHAKSRQCGEDWGIMYPFGMIDELIAAHERRDVIIDYAIVATPNNQHAPVAIPLLNAGIAVLLEKPMANTLENAMMIAETAERTGVPLRLAHTYFGYAMSQMLFDMAWGGMIGEIRTMDVYYRQGWLGLPIERDGQRQAVARTDRNISGSLCAGLDIGSHCIAYVEAVAGQITEVSAMLTSCVPGRQLDDDFRVNCRFESGAVGTLIATQVDQPEMNHHTVRVVGSEGTLAWDQESPEILEYGDGKTLHLIRRGHGDFPPRIAALNHTPSGHIEGFHAALSRVHDGMEDAVLVSRGFEPCYPGLFIPGPKEGISTMQVLRACLESSRGGCFMPVIRG